MFEKQHCEDGQNVALIRYQFGSNIKCDIENIELSPGKIVILQSVYCWLEMCMASFSHFVFFHVGSTKVGRKSSFFGPL